MLLTKRFLILCLVVLCLGTATQAAAAPFGIFDNTKSLDSNLSSIYPDAIFIDGIDHSTLDQGFYFQAVFAASSMIDAGSKFFTVSNSEYEFSNLSASWGLGSTRENIADMTVLHNGTTYSFADLAIDISLYVGEQMTYKPNSALSTMLVEGGSYFVSFSIPGSGNAFDFVFALSPNPVEFRSTPAPAALILFGTGLAGIIAARRRVKN